MFFGKTCTDLNDFSTFVHKYTKAISCIWSFTSIDFNKFTYLHINFASVFLDYNINATK